MTNLATGYWRLLTGYWPLATQTGRTGGNRTPNPRFWRPVLCQLSYCPLNSEGLRPSDSLHRRSRAASPARSAPVARVAALARAQLLPDLFGFPMRLVAPAETAVLRQL